LISSFFFLSIYITFNRYWVLILFTILFRSPLMFFTNLRVSFLRKNLFFSLDIFSFIIVILTLWIIFLRIFSRFSIFYSSTLKLFLFRFNLLFLFLVISFISNNLLFFFFFFESTLVPTLFVIIGWGYKIERLKSGIYLFFYTLLGSLPMLTIIFFFKRY